MHSGFALLPTATSSNPSISPPQNQEPTKCGKSSWQQRHKSRSLLASPPFFCCPPLKIDWKLGQWSMARSFIILLNQFVIDLACIAAAARQHRPTVRGFFFLLLHSFWCREIKSKSCLHCSWDDPMISSCRSDFKSLLQIEIGKDEWIEGNGMKVEKIVDHWGSGKWQRRKGLSLWLCELKWILFDKQEIFGHF